MLFTQILFVAVFVGLPLVTLTGVLLLILTGLARRLGIARNGAAGEEKITRDLPMAEARS